MSISLQGETLDNEEEKNKKSKKSNKSKTKSEKGEEKDIYFIIFYQLKQKENEGDLVFPEESEIKPKTILKKEIKTSNNKFVYKKVFKFKNIGAKKKEQLIFFIGEDDKYIINLELKEKSFIYDVDLKKGHKYLDNIAKVDIDQKSMDYQDKLDLFLEALKQNKEESKTQELYQETIELYSKKKGFSFMISLFAKIYQEKVLCESLIKMFYEMNVNNKLSTKNDGNSDRNEKLSQYNSLMVKIASESETLISNNNYDPIQFYGIIICYFNFYDYTSFEKYINTLYKEKREILFEILLVYFSHFLKPVKKDENDKEFFIKFFEYIISKKGFSSLILGLTFISDIDTFINVIDKAKDKIYDTYVKDNKENNKGNFKVIKIKDDLKLKKERINDIIKGIKSINQFSDTNNFILVYFKSEFWKNLLKEFNKPSPDCFIICWKLRELFIDYDKLIKKICDKEKDKDIIKDIKNYRDIDAFAYLLNENIKNFFKEKRGKLKNSEILGYIQKYNPYYIEDGYKHNRELYILDDLVFEYDYNNNDEDVISEHQNFIETFRKLEYEDIYKNNMVKFLDTMVNKVKDISSFDTVMDLIRVDKIKEKVNEYIEKLKSKYELIIKADLEKLGDKNIDKPVEIIAKFAKLIFEHEENCDFLEQQIDKLKISSSIYNQLMRICKDDKFRIMKEFIFKIFLSKNNIKNVKSIIELIDSLEKTDQETFFKELMKKCVFKKEEFYSTEENNKINLLCELYKEKKIEKISGEIQNTLDDIINDIDKEEIEKKKIEEFLKNTEEVAKKRLALIKIRFNELHLIN